MFGTKALITRIPYLEYKDICALPLLDQPKFGKDQIFAGNFSMPNCSTSDFNNYTTRCLATPIVGA